MAFSLSQLPQNYLVHLLAVNPTLTTYFLGGLAWTRAQVLSAVDGLGPVNNQVVGLHAVPSAPLKEVHSRSDLK